MKKLENIQLIIFDLDGTLVDSGLDICDATNEVLAHYGKPLLAYEDIPSFLGSGLKALLRKALETEKEKKLAEARRLFDQAYSRNFTNKTRPYPGVILMLEQLSGIKKAVFSNKAHAFTVGMIQKLGLNPHFEYVLGARPEAFDLKPSPAGIHLILDALQIAPENTLMVGDSTHDIEAGKAAGVYTAAVSYGYRPLAMLEAMQPDLVIHDMGELRGWILSSD